MSYKAPKGYHPWNKTNNPLLLKDDVGKGKPTAYDIPHKDFVYGRPLPYDKEGAKHLTSNWMFHSETVDKEPARDFKQLNKMSIQNRSLKANEQSQFRKSYDARQKVQKGKNALPLYIPEEDFRYGKSNRPSTPVKLVLGNCYGLDSEAKLNEHYYTKSVQQSYERPSTAQIPRGNKASVLSYQYIKTKQEKINKSGSQDYFKLSKFKNVEKKVSTTRQRPQSAVVQQKNSSQVKFQDNQSQKQQDNQSYQDAQSQKQQDNSSYR